MEYTGRILRQKLGVCVPRSVVVHKTSKMYATTDADANRFFYYVRNTLWMLFYSNAWTRNERLKLGFDLLRALTIFLRRSKFQLVGMMAIARGICDGVFKRPHQ